jgi:hypothetical protein
MSRTAEGSDPGRRGYASYLLRIWRLERGGREIWRLMLVDPRTGKEHRFARLEDMVRYLADPGSPPPPLAHDPDQ